MNTRLLLILSMIVALLSSCVTPKDTNLLQNIRKDYPMAENLINSDYRIIPGDRLSLRIYTIDEDLQEIFSVYVKSTSTGRETAQSTVTGNQNSLNVYSDGTIKIPYLGRLYVQDLTILEAQKIIEEKFKTLSSDPTRLTVEVSLSNRFFSMLGKAGNKRIAMPTTKINIFQALALSGPIETFADRTHVKIIRQTPNGTEVKVFDIRTKDIVDSEYYYIQPNDVIYVQEMSRTFFGRVTSFTGVLGLFGLVTTVVGAVVLIINLTK